ncbi:MAG: YggS family pyridoxal phosphate-dependent enzyme [Deltaproteobacteria bacterium]|nr:YggS family pyridoxal phosphate-dependent enzyme [Deltaproteobacteria bacterium]
MSTLAERLAAVQAQVAEACRAAGRDPAEVCLVAVSKRQPDALLLEAYAAGQRDFGENYVQEMLRKQPLLPPDARWHLIGHVQSNKAKAAATAHLLHTLDSEKLARALARAAEAEGRRLDVLVEVNLAHEDQKAGVDPEGVEALIEVAQATGWLEVQGLMCIPPEGEGPRYFPELRRLRDDLVERLKRPLPILSMGMSGDFEAAIAAGATVVRVGTAIFGARG